MVGKQFFRLIGFEVFLYILYKAPMIEHIKGFDTSAVDILINNIPNNIQLFRLPVLPSRHTP